MSQAGAEVAQPSRRPFELSSLLEALTGICLLAATALALRAGKVPDSEVAQQSPFGLFFRKVLIGNLAPTGEGVSGHHVKFWLVLAAVGAVLLIQLVWPKLRAEARSATVALAVMLLLVPVLNYGPQLDRLVMAPSDAAVLAQKTPEQVQLDRAYNTFRPVLPVTVPLAAAAVLMLAWAFVTPREQWPSTFVAFGFVTLVAVGGGVWLTGEMIRARGSAQGLDYSFWPQAIAAIWILGQLLTAATAAAVAGRQQTGSRWLSAATLVVLVATVAITRGAR